MFVVLGARGKLPTAGHLAQLQSSIPSVELLRQLSERFLDHGAILAEHFRNDLCTERLFGNKDQSFNDAPAFGRILNRISPRVFRCIGFDCGRFCGYQCLELTAGFLVERRFIQGRFQIVVFALFCHVVIN